MPGCLVSWSHLRHSSGACRIGSVDIGIEKSCCRCSSVCCPILCFLEIGDKATPRHTNRLFRGSVGFFVPSSPARKHTSYFGPLCSRFGAWWRCAERRPLKAQEHGLRARSSIRIAPFFLVGCCARRGNDMVSKPRSSASEEIFLGSLNRRLANAGLAVWWYARKTSSAGASDAHLSEVAIRFSRTGSSGCHCWRWSAFWRSPGGGAKVECAARSLPLVYFCNRTLCQRLGLSRCQLRSAAARSWRIITNILLNVSLIAHCFCAGTREAVEALAETPNEDRRPRLLFFYCSERWEHIPVPGRQVYPR